MGRIKNPIDLSEAKQGVLIELKKTNNTFNRQLAKKYKCDKNTIRNILKRPGQVEKENLDPLSSEARSQSGRHLAFNEQLHRRPVRHTTKGSAQRRKPWVQIAHEIGQQSKELDTDDICLNTSLRYRDRS